MAYRTLESMRTELLARLGMGGMGASGGANLTLIDSFLRNGQAQLYRMQDWKHLIDYEDKTLGTDQNLLDYPTSGVMNGSTCARDKRVLRLEYLYNGQWLELTEGITTEMWSTMETLASPVRYERYSQLLIYPKADQTYTVRVWFVADLGAFTENDHVATLDDEMVFLHALANAKAHYRQPDAQTYQGQLNTMLASLRGQSFGSNSVYRRGSGGAPDRKPAVVGRDV
tara:strand:+ start:247 stop:927 length:681 start_codon:yes stop_codon:yes gene_type:complete